MLHSRLQKVLFAAWVSKSLCIWRKLIGFWHYVIHSSVFMFICNSAGVCSSALMSRQCAIRRANSFALIFWAIVNVVFSVGGRSDEHYSLTLI